MRTNKKRGAHPDRGLEARLLAFVGGLILDATAQIASGAVDYVLGYRRRARRARARRVGAR